VDSEGQNSWERTANAEEELARRIGTHPSLKQLIGHFSFAETDEDLDENTIQPTILPEQRSYTALRVRGFSSIAAARMLNLNMLAAQRWELSNWFEAVREEELKKWLVGAGIDQKQEAMFPLFPDAMEAIKDTLHSEDPKIKFQAAQFVIDNLFGEARRPVGRPRNNDTHSDNSPDLTDIMASAIARINEARRETTNGALVGIVSSTDYVNGHASPNSIDN
jgi:hypothetical protein